jgi:hypothetical protein
VFTVPVPLDGDEVVTRAGYFFSIMGALPFTAIESRVVATAGLRNAGRTAITATKVVTDDALINLRICDIFVLPFTIDYAT